MELLLQDTCQQSEYEELRFVPLRSKLLPSLRQFFALAEANFCPFDGKKQLLKRQKIQRIESWKQWSMFWICRRLLRKNPFTLHLYAWKPCVYRGFLGWRVIFNPSSTLHHLSPLAIISYSHLLLSVCPYQPSKTEVKGGERWVKGQGPPFTPRTHDKHRDFKRKGEGWRVKRKVWFCKIRYP